MKSISKKVNPTGLKNLDRKLVSIRIDYDRYPPRFRIERLDLESASIENGLDILLLAEAGNTRSRTLVGKTGQPIDKGWIDASELDHSSHFTFRIALRTPSDPRIMASIDGIRPVSQNGLESLVDMTSSDLGERVWCLDLNSDRPVLRINSRVFPSTSGAQSFIHFSALVMPEVLAQVLGKIGDDPSLLESGTDWAEWREIIDKFAPGLLETDDEDIKQELIDDAVRMFSNEYRFASQLNAELERSQSSQ